MRIGFIKTISIAISVALFGCFNAQAANWNTKDKSINTNSLSLAPVPRAFPQYAMTLDEECKTSKGKKWSSTISGFYGDGLFWASIHAYRRDWVRIYEGKPLGDDGYLIRVGEAAKKWKDNPNWISYKSSSKDIKTALLKGLVGRYSSGGGYWRECKLTARSLSDNSKISISKERPFGRQWASLNTIAHKQKNALQAMLELGVQRTSGYDFKAAQDAIAAAVQREENARIAKQRETQKKKELELAAKKKAVEEAKRAAELAAKKKAEEEAKRAAELAAKKKAEEEAKRAAELAAKKKAEEEAKRAAELAAKKKAEEEARRAAELAAKYKAQREAEKKAKQLEDLLKAKEAKMAELKKQLAAAEERNKKLANAQSKQKKEDDRKQAISEAIKTGPQKIETTLKLQSLNVGELGNEFGDGFNNFSARQNHRLLPVYLCVENTGAEGFDISSKISFGVGFKDATFVMASDEGTIAWNSQENINELSKSVAANKKACGVKVFEVPIEKTKALDTIFIERSGVVIVKRGIK